MSIGGIGWTESQRIHDCQRSGTHRNNVADNATDTGRCSLIRLNIGRVIVAFHLESDCPALTDVDDASIFTDANKERIGLWCLFPKLTRFPEGVN